MKLYTNKELNNPYNTSYSVCADIHTRAELEYFAANFGYCMCLFDDGLDSTNTIVKNQRRIANFLQSNVLFTDIDENLSIKDFYALYSKYEFYLTTSKSHTDEHNRFHVLFPIHETITNVDDYKHYQYILQTTIMLGKSDQSCKDISKPFAGSPNNKTMYNKGMNILNYIKLQPRIVQQKIPDYKIPDGVFKHSILYRLRDKDFSSYDEWIKLGMALKSSGFTLYDWIELSDKKVPEKLMIYKWDNFKPNIINHVYLLNKIT